MIFSGVDGWSTSTSMDTTGARKSLGNPGQRGGNIVFKIYLRYIDQIYNDQIYLDQIKADQI